MYTINANYKAPIDFDHDRYVHVVEKFLMDYGNDISVTVEEFTDFNEDNFKKSKIKIVGLPVPTHTLKVQMQMSTDDDRTMLVALQYLSMKLGIKKGLGISNQI